MFPESNVHGAAMSATMKPDICINPQSEPTELLQIAWPLDGLQHWKQACEQLDGPRTSALITRTRDAHVAGGQSLGLAFGLLLYGGRITLGSCESL